MVTRMYAPIANASLMSGCHHHIFRSEAGKESWVLALLHKSTGP